MSVVYSRGIVSKMRRLNYQFVLIANIIFLIWVVTIISLWRYDLTPNISLLDTRFNSAYMLREKQSITEALEYKNLPLLETNKKDILLPASSPLSFKNGGLILFFHIPKSAGSSITFDIKSQPKDFEFISADNRKESTSFPVAKRRIEELTEKFPHSDNRIRFVEFHGKHPTFSSLHGTIKRWRERAASIDMPFFVFTITRDPINLQISTFNFFCIQINKYVKCGVPHTIKGLLQKCPSNPQTRWLCHSSETFMAGNFSCPHLHEQIIDQIDWVGTMEKFDETIEVVSKVIFPHKLKGFVKNKGIKVKGVIRKDLNKSNIMRLKQSTEVDAALYQMVKEHYQIADILSKSKDLKSISIS